MYKRLLLLVCCAFSIFAASATDISATKHISSANGLSNDFVVRMVIDGDGYTWVATESGVTRIAGNNCTVFNTAEDKKQEQCTALYYHQESQQVMIGTEGGTLNIYNCREGKMRRMTKEDGLTGQNIVDITGAADGNVWLVLGNGQIQKMNIKTDQLSNQKINELHGNRCALDDGKGWLYIGHSKHGMTMVQVGGNSIRRFVHEPANPKSLPSNNVRKIIKDSENRIWVGTDHGLALFHPENGTFDIVTEKDNDYNENIYDICEMSDGSIWVALDLGGIKIARDLLYEDTKVRLSSLNVRSIICDTFNNVWVGNHSTGVDIISSEESPFHILEYNSPSGIPTHINTLCIDREEFMWIGTQDELSRWQDSQLFNRWPYRSAAMREHNFIRTLMADRQGNIWMGIDDQGVYCFDPKSGTAKPVSIGIECCDIHAFGEDERGRIWIGSEMGVYTYDHGFVERQDNISMATKNLPVSCFLWVGNGRMFISSIGAGLTLIGTGTLDTSNGLPSNKINHVITDNDGGIWVATFEGLVHVKNVQRLEGISIYNQQQGLANNHIIALQLDDEGRVWMSTYSGISCFNPKTKRFYNYNRFDNRYLSGFTDGAAAKDYAGRIYFASAQGLCYFNPSDLDGDKGVSQVQIVSCEAYSPVGSETEITTLTPDEDSVVKADYNQNTLRLLFTLHNIAQTGREEYSYMMKGIDDQWYYLGDNQEVVFRRLDPGNYTFIVRAKLKEQDWENATEAQIFIQIAPPFWKSWWAYLIYVLIIGFVGRHLYTKVIRFNRNHQKKT